MAHYALLNSDNIVTQVITGKDETDTTHNWETYYGNVHSCTVKRTSYNTYAGQHVLGGTPFRKNYAGVGMIYDASRDAFIEPQPYASWVLNETTCYWEAPITQPALTNEEEVAKKYYDWDESAYQADNTKGWVLKQF